MASTSDWWARRLGQQQPAAPPPVAPPPAQQQAPPTWATPSAQPPPQVPEIDQINTGDEIMDAVARAALVTGGSQQAQEDSGRCPECGSGNYFSRNYTEQGMRMRTPAAPRCYDCGFPVVQAGSSRGGATTVRPEGPSHRARQLPKNHAVTVVDQGRTITYKPR